MEAIMVCVLLGVVCASMVDTISDKCLYFILGLLMIAMFIIMVVNLVQF